MATTLIVTFVGGVIVGGILAAIGWLLKGDHRRKIKQVLWRRASDSPLNPEVRKVRADRKQFRALEKMFGRPLIEWAREHHFISPFDQKLMVPFLDYKYGGSAPEYEFLDPILEAKRQEFLAAVVTFGLALLLYTVPMWDGRGLQSLGREVWDPSDPTYEARTREATEALDSAGLEAANAYDELVKSARDRLKV